MVSWNLRCDVLSWSALQMDAVGCDGRGFRGGGRPGTVVQAIEHEGRGVEGRGEVGQKGVEEVGVGHAACCSPDGPIARNREARLEAREGV